MGCGPGVWCGVLSPGVLSNETRMVPILDLAQMKDTMSRLEKSVEHTSCSALIQKYISSFLQFSRKTWLPGACYSLSCRCFQSSSHKLPPRVRAIDMRHILLLLPFLLDRLLTDVFLEHNRAHTSNHVNDPASDLVGSTLLLFDCSTCIAEGIHQRMRLLSRP